MSPIICLSILLLLFCTESAALRCYTCDGDNCTKVVRCNDSNVCMSSTTIKTVDGVLNVTRGRYCTTAHYCDRIGRVGVVSITVDSVIHVANVKCCRSDLCNDEDLDVPPRQLAARPSGLLCKVCGPDRETCRIEQCFGGQTFCRKPSVDAQREEGCATGNFCLLDQFRRTEPFPGFAGGLQFTAGCTPAVIPEPPTPEPKCVPIEITPEPPTPEPTTLEPKCVPIEITPEPITPEPTTPEPKCVPIETTPEPTLPPCGRNG